MPKNKTSPYEFSATTIFIWGIIGIFLLLYIFFIFNTDAGVGNYFTALKIPKYPNTVTWTVRSSGSIVSGASTQICFNTNDNADKVFNYYNNKLDNIGSASKIVIPFPTQYPHYKELCVDTGMREVHLNESSSSSTDTNYCRYSIIISSSRGRCKDGSL